MKRIVGTAVAAFLATSCSADVTELMVAPELGAEGDVAQNEEGSALLALGDSGPEVVAAHAWFTRYGYFEDAALREAYPRWRPVVGRGPADESVFGEELRLAVSLYQARGGLEVTGAIDGPTRAQMDAPRCRWPDSGGVMGQEKWDDHQTFGWQSDHTLSYFIGLRPADNYGEMDDGEVTQAINNAFNTWEAATNIDFSIAPTEAAADIEVTFIDQGALGIGRPTIIFMANSNSWGFGSTDIHMETVLLHEIGHTLGFDHSSMDIPTLAVMWPVVNFGEVRNQLTADEKKAISASPYMSWIPVTGASNEAKDVGSSVVGSTEHTWRVSNTNTIQRWNGSSWAAAVDGTAVRIDLAGATPWIVTSAGLARERVSGAWVNRGDLDFVDIGANANGRVWALGGAPDVNGNYKIYRYLSGSSWQEVDGKARHIDVGSNNAPWVINNGGSIYQRSGVTTANPSGSSWSNYGSGARDVGAAVDGSTWVTGPGANGAIFLLNIQPAVAANCSPTPSQCNVEHQNRWFPTADGGLANFVTAGFLPWIVGPNGSSWRRNQ